MDRKTFAAARDEARRFLQRCDDVERECADLLKLHGNWSSERPNKWTGALRRASMDLTRALADLRRTA